MTNIPRALGPSTLSPRKRIFAGFCRCVFFELSFPELPHYSWTPRTAKMVFAGGIHESGDGAEAVHAGVQGRGRAVEPPAGQAGQAGGDGFGDSAARPFRWRCEMQLTGEEAFRGHGRRTAAEDELARLRRQVAELTMERDILKKATAFFARHQR
jgi:hypothetical protein